ncbi:hypothetical protein, partial [uncultured Lamprocystis sp.]|uniref:hypothetical protein n=1 Tax=uncultured Lamprocystis sp. TaxID=543132 RepID=UPI0025D141C5
MINAQTTRLSFAIDDTSMWGPNQATAVSFTFDQLQWNRYATGSYTASVPFAPDPTLHYSLNASIGPSFAASLNTGSIDILYPIEVDVRTPDSVQTGTTFVVDTSDWSVLNAALDSVAPSLSAQASLNFEVNASYGLDIGGINIPSLHNDLVNIDYSTVLLDTSAYNSGSYDFGGILQVGYNLPTDLNAHAQLSGATDRYLPTLSASAQQSDFFLYLNGDLDNLARYYYPVIPPLDGQLDGSVSVPLFGTATAALDYTILDVDIAAGIKLAQAFTFVPTGVNVTLTASTGEILSGRLGQQFEFTAPSDGAGEITIDAAYTLTGQLRNQSGFVVGGQLSATAMDFGLETNLLDDPIDWGPLASGSLQVGSRPFYLYDSIYNVNLGTSD